jgi:hypothetical protein
VVSLLSVPIGLQPCILSLALSTLKEEMIESNCKEIEHPASPSQEINIFDKTYSMQTLSQEHKIRAYFFSNRISCQYFYQGISAIESIYSKMPADSLIFWAPSSQMCLSAMLLNCKCNVTSPKRFDCPKLHYCRNGYLQTLWTAFYERALFIIYIFRKLASTFCAKLITSSNTT